MSVSHAHHLPTSTGIRLTILGCGSSGGVPRLGGHNGQGEWGACDPFNPKNRRRRCSLLVEKYKDNDHITRILIDTSPDMREQLLSANVKTLDAVVYTHNHADHIHGLDDLRMVYFNQNKQPVAVFADSETATVLLTRFHYAFVQTADPNSDYPGILNLYTIDHNHPLFIHGAGGAVTINPIPVQHGRARSLGFRFEHCAAYIPDVHAINTDSWQLLENLDLLIIDSLRYLPHPSHAHLGKTLEWIAKLNPKQAVLTNLHIDLDYNTLEQETPANVTPGFDGMVLNYPLDDFDNKVQKP